VVGRVVQHCRRAVPRRLPRTGADWTGATSVTAAHPLDHLAIATRQITDACIGEPFPRYSSMAGAQYLWLVLTH
jgi:hypothetical protein